MRHFCRIKLLGERYATPQHQQEACGEQGVNGRERLNVAAAKGFQAVFPNLPEETGTTLVGIACERLAV